jgi:hypothetical protein
LAVIGRIQRNFWRFRERVLSKAALMLASRRAWRPRAGRKHELPGELIVSLTSYPARFATLHLTLGCLLDQSIKADRTILWIAHDDLDELPAAVRELERHGLDIRGCDDLRSYKKLVPALGEFRDAYIATADDDVYYSRGWLETLVSGTGERVITCRRAHRMTRSEDGALRPYLQWEFAVQDEAAGLPSADILPTGIGGMLYPPRSLDPRVTDRSLFQRLCPDGDDLWFYWCARMAGTLYRKVGGRFRVVTWPGTQASSLWTSNEAGGNDRMIKALEAEFGPLP